MLDLFFSVLNKFLMNSKKTILFKQKILPNLIASFANFLTLVPYIILKIRSKRFKQEKEKDMNII